MRRSVAGRFAAAARTYDRYADVQRDVARNVAALAARVRLPPENPLILEIGCGTGVLTHLIHDQFPRARITVVDVVERMVAQTRRALAGCERVDYVVGDGSNFAARRRFPLIVSSSALHWMTPLGDTVGNVARLLAQGGVLIASVMLDGTLGELHAARRLVVPAKRPHGRLPTSREVRGAVAEAGLCMEDSKEEILQMAYSSARDLLERIHALGLTGGRVSIADRPLTRTELDRLVAHYEETYANETGGVQASYRVLYVRAVR